MVIFSFQNPTTGTSDTKGEESSAHGSDTTLAGVPDHKPVENDNISSATRCSSDPSASQPSDPVYDADFNFSDATIQIQAGGLLFRVHKFKLGEFEGLKPKLEQTRAGEVGRRNINLEDNHEDIHNTLVMLYSSVYHSKAFDIAILKSTLKLATKYSHPALREYVIKELEKHSLEPIERFALSRDYDISGWMAKANDDLCARDEPISISEARILGTEKFVEIAARREAAKFEKGSRMRASQFPPIFTGFGKPEAPVPTPPATQSLKGIFSAPNGLLEPPKAPNSGSNHDIKSLDTKCEPSKPSFGALPLVPTSDPPPVLQPNPFIPFRTPSQPQISNPIVTAQPKKPRPSRFANRPTDSP